MLKKQNENGDKLFVIYQSVVKNWRFETKIRGYKSPISMRNFGNQVSDKAVETLLKVCTEERKIYWRWSTTHKRVICKTCCYSNVLALKHSKCA